MISVDLPVLLKTPLPDEAHEALRVACMEAIGNLTDQSVSMDDFRLALQTLSKLASDYVAALQASIADRTQLNNRVAALEARALVGVTGQLTKTLTLGVGGTLTNYGITFTKPMPSADYLALVSLDNTSLSLLGNVAPVYPVVNKTAFGCTVPVRNTAALTLAQSVTVQVAALQLN